MKNEIKMASKIVTKNDKRRIPELDLFKSLAIILVICGHLIQINWIDSLNSHPIITWIYSFHMPLFFFISGFLVYHTFGNSSVWCYIRRKVLSLLVPYFIWCYVVDPVINKEKLWAISQIMLSTHSSYWFIYLLFLYSLIFYCGQIICRGPKGVFGGAVLGLILMAVLQYLFPALLFSRGIQFFPIYVFGVLASCFKFHEKAVLFKEPLLSIILVLFIVCSLNYCQLESTTICKLCKFSASFAICYVVLYFIWGRFVDTDNQYMKLLMYVGKNSIVVYLTHFFFLRLFFTPAFDSTTLTPFWSFIICLFMALIILLVCLMIGWIVEHFIWVNRLFYGREW